MGRTRTDNPHRQSLPFSTADVHAPAANTAAVVTYAAVAGPSGTAGVGNQPVPAGYLNSANLPANVSHVIEGFIATVVADAVIAAASAPYIKIEDGSGNIVHSQYLELCPEGITSGKAFYKADVRYTHPMRGTAGRALILTIPANGANTVNKLTVLGHRTEIA